MLFFVGKILPTFTFSASYSSLAFSKKDTEPPNKDLIFLWLVHVLKKSLHPRYQYLTSYCCSNYRSFSFHQRKAQERRSPRSRPQTTAEGETLSEMQRQGLKLPGTAFSSNSCPLVCDWGSGKGQICSRLFTAADKPIGRPLESKYSVLIFVSSISVF